MFPKATAKILRSMEDGETRILTESEKVYAGSAVQSFATRAGLQVTTTQCFVVLPKRTELIKAVSVTRVGVKNEQSQRIEDEKPE
jgi:hypothetical protein